MDRWVGYKTEHQWPSDVQPGVPQGDQLLKGVVFYLSMELFSHLAVDRDVSLSTDVLTFTLKYHIFSKDCLVHTKGLCTSLPNKK